MAIEQNIQALLYSHDCVIVPDFGGFLTHYRPARLDEARKLMHPPAKDLSFNRNLTRQDGLLADHVAKQGGVDFNEARRLVDAQVEEWKAKLQAHGRLEIGSIGTFFRDGGPHLQFEPDKRSNLLKDAFGLRPVAAVAIARPEVIPEPRVIPLPKPERTIEMEEETSKPKSLLLAAAVIAVLFTAATWWTVTANGPEGAIWSGFDVFRPNVASRYVMPAPPPSIAVTPEPRQEDWTAPKDLSGVQMMPIAGAGSPLVAVDMGKVPDVAPPEPKSTTTMPDRQAKYHIIGGCFAEKENADRYIADLQAKGFAASLIDHKGGLYRVAYGSYPLLKTAKEALHAVRKEMAADAWLLVQ